MWINYLPYIVDGICLVVVLGFFITGWKTGFASSAVKTCSFLIAIVITYFFYSRVSAFLCQAGMEQAIVEHIQIETEEISLLNLPGIVKFQLSENNTSAVYAALGVTSMMSYLKHALARIIINGVSILVVFLVSVVLLGVIAKQLRHVNKIPLVGMVNELLGGVCSLIVGGVLIMFSVFVITSLSTSVEGFKILSDAIENSYASVVLEKINLFNNWFIRIV